MEHANHAFCRMMGYEAAEVVRMTAADFLAEQSRSQVGTIADATRTEGIWRGTLVRHRRDGSTFLTSCTVTSLADDAGRITQLVGVERDVTRETELRDQLIHTERLAAAGQLVSGVAHELNNPLQSVVGFTELLLEGETATGNPGRPRAHPVGGEPCGQDCPQPAGVRPALVGGAGARQSVNDLVQSALALRSYELGVANIAIDADYAEDLPQVRVNREEIQQVLLNLLLECRARDEDDIAIAVTCASRRWPATERVVVEVQDDGPGVPQSVAGRIFEPFFSTKEVGQGTGLGLSIALGIIEAHGGTLVLAEASEGACFRLTLPVPPSPKLRQESIAGAARRFQPASLGQRALVADDEEPVRMLLRRLLTRRGFAVDLATDGQMADTLLEQQPVRRRAVRRQDAERRGARALRQHPAAAAGRAGPVRVHQRRHSESPAPPPERLIAGVVAVEALRRTQARQRARSGRRTSPRPAGRRGCTPIAGTDYRFFAAAFVGVFCSTTSFARNLAMASMSATGTVSESGKRIVPLLTSYGARSFLNAATRRAVAG